MATQHDAGLSNFPYGTTNVPYQAPAHHSWMNHPLPVGTPQLHSAQFGGTPQAHNFYPPHAYAPSAYPPQQPAYSHPYLPVNPPNQELRSSRGGRLSLSYEAKQLRGSEVVGYRAAGILPIAMMPIGKATLERAISDVAVVARPRPKEQIQEQPTKAVNEEEILLPDLEDMATSDTTETSIPNNSGVSDEAYLQETTNPASTPVNAPSEDLSSTSINPSETPTNDITTTPPANDISPPAQPVEADAPQENLSAPPSNDINQSEANPPSTTVEPTVVAETPQQIHDESSKDVPMQSTSTEPEETILVPHLLLGVEERFLRSTTGGDRTPLGKYVNFLGGRRDDENDCDAEFTAVREFMEETGQAGTLQETLYYRYVYPILFFLVFF